MTKLPNPLLSRVVLIGTGHYKTLGKIDAVHNNLADLANVLRADRFWGLPRRNCVVVEDPRTPADMLDPVQVAAQNATDTLLLYYVGHGLVDPRRFELHLALVDSDPRRIYTAVQYSHIRDVLLESQAARRIVILDCCYSGRALGQMAADASAVVNEASAEGTYVLAASAENKAALAPPGRRHTAFTGELLSVIRNGIPGHGPLLDLESIYRRLIVVMKEKGFPRPQKRDRNTAGALTLIRNQAFRPPTTVLNKGHPIKEAKPSSEIVATSNAITTAGPSLIPSSARTGQIDQIVYDYAALGQDLLGREGVGPIAASQTAFDLVQWDRILRLRLTSDKNYHSPSMCYIVKGDQAALLYRTMRDKRSQGSVFAHVLIGDRETLSVTRALGSWRWNWPGAVTPQSLPAAKLVDPVGAKDFTSAADVGWAALSSGAATFPELDTLVIELLCSPHLAARKFTIIAQSGELRIKLLGGIARILGPGFFAGGFSTHESVYDESEDSLPDFIFASSSPSYTSRQISRPIVDLGKTARMLDRDAAAAARILAKAYGGAEPEANVIGLIANAQADGVSADEAEWLQDLLYNPRSWPAPTIVPPGSALTMPSGNFPAPDYSLSTADPVISVHDSHMVQDDFSEPAPTSSETLQRAAHNFPTHENVQYVERVPHEASPASVLGTNETKNADPVLLNPTKSSRADLTQSDRIDVEANSSTGRLLDYTDSFFIPSQAQQSPPLTVSMQPPVRVPQAVAETLEGHSGWVEEVTFNGDGSLIGTASTDGSARIWDPASGACLFTLMGHGRAVCGVAFNPDGTLLATGGADKTVRIWDPTTGDHLQTLKGHTDPVLAVTFGSNGLLLASASRDGTTRIWDPATGEHLRTLGHHKGSVMGVAFSPDGSLLATASDDKTAVIWNPGTGERLDILKGHASGIRSVAFSPDGSLLATASGDGTAWLWAVATGERLRACGGHNGPLLGVAFSADGALLATGSTDGTARVWDMASRFQVTLEHHTGEVTSVAFSPNESLLATGSVDKTVLLWR